MKAVNNSFLFFHAKFEDEMYLIKEPTQVNTVEEFETKVKMFE